MSVFRRCQFHSDAYICSYMQIPCMYIDNIVCVYIYFFVDGTQWLSPRPRNEFRVSVQCPPAKSGPIVSPYSCTTMVEHNWKNSQGTFTEASTGNKLRECQNEAAMAPHSAGGYSLSTIVQNFPSLPWPMLTFLGSSSTILHLQTSVPNVGRLSVSTMVGLADGAPNNKLPDLHTR